MTRVQHEKTASWRSQELNSMSKGAMAAAAVATGLQDLVQARLTSLDIAGPHITLVTAFQLPVHTHLMTVILYQSCTRSG